MGKPKHDPDEIERKIDRAGKGDPNVTNPIAKKETISEEAVRRENNRKMTKRDIR